MKKTNLSVLPSQRGWHHGGKKRRGGKNGKNGGRRGGRRGGGGKGRRGGGRRGRGGRGFGRGLGYGLGLGLLGGGYGYGYGYPPYGPYGYGYGPYGRGLWLADQVEHEELKHHVENLKSALEDPTLSAERRVRLETLGERIDELFPSGVLIPLTEDLSKDHPDHKNVKEYNSHAKQHNLSIKNGYDDEMSKEERLRTKKQAAKRGLRLYKLRKKLKENGNWNPY